MSSTTAATATGGASSTANAQNFKLLEALIKQIPDKGLDWNKVAEEMGSTPGAVRERWRRYKIANNINSPAPVTDGSNTPAKKGRPAKRKNESINCDEETSIPSKRTPAKKTKAAKSTEKVTDGYDEDESSEVPVTPQDKKSVSKKATPAKEVTPKSKKLTKQLVKDEDEDEAAEDASVNFGVANLEAEIHNTRDDTISPMNMKTEEEDLGI